MNRNMKFLLVALFLWGTGESMFFYFQPLYLQELGADPLTIGAILGAFGLMMTIAHIPAGHLSDKIGRRPLLRTAWIIGVSAATIMSLARSLPFFVLGMMLYGFTAFVSSPLSSYATAARDNLSVSRTLTLVSGVYNVGMVIGPLIGGWLGDHLGLRTTYAGSATLFFFSTILIFFLQPQPVDAQDPSAPPPGLLTNQRYLSFLALSFFVIAALYLPQPLTPNFLQNERGLNLSSIGLIGSVGGLGNVVLNLVLGGIANTTLAYVLSQACVALYVLFIWRGTGIPFYAAAYFLMGGYRVTRTLASAQVNNFVHGSQMGLAYGITETVNALPTILAPPLAGFLYEKSPEMIYMLSFALIGVMLISTALIVPQLDNTSSKTARTEA